MSAQTKYKNIKELAAAFASGELKRDEYRLSVDNDAAHLIFIGDPPTGMDEDAWFESKNDECYYWFRGNGYRDVVDACIAAGIPAEWC